MLDSDIAATLRVLVAARRERIASELQSDRTGVASAVPPGAQDGATIAGKLDGLDSIVANARSDSAGVVKVNKLLRRAAEPLEPTTKARVSEVMSNGRNGLGSSMGKNLGPGLSRHPALP